MFLIRRYLGLGDNGNDDKNTNFTNDPLYHDDDSTCGIKPTEADKSTPGTSKPTADKKEMIDTTVM